MSGQRDHQPAGYCPHCGYALDPGTCPECGKFVRGYQIRAVPPNVTLRRDLWRFGGVLLLLAISIGGYRAYRDLNGWPYVPEWLLVQCQHRDWSGAMAEINRRFVADEFTADARQRLIDNAMTAEIECPDRWPAGKVMPVVLQVSARAPVSKLRCFTWSPVWRFKIGSDEAWSAVEAWSPVGMRCSSGKFAVVYETKLELPPLEAAAHDLRFDGNVALLTAVPGFLTDQRWSVAVSKVLRVEDKRFTDYVTPIWRNDLAAKMKDAVAARYFHQADYGNIDFATNVLPVPVCFRVYVRVSGEHTYRHLSHVVDGARVPGSHGYYDYELGSDVTSIDLQLRPDLAHAHLRGLKTCFNGVIEWDNLLVSAGQHFGGATEPPTRVFKYEG